MLKARSLSASDRSVLHALAHRMNNKTGQCDPGYDTLASDTGLSKGKVAQSIKALWQAGILDWEDRWKPDSKERDTNLYTIPHAPHPIDPEKRVVLEPLDCRTEKRVVPKPPGSKEGVPPGARGGVSPSGTPCITQYDSVYHPVAQGVSPVSREQGTNREENLEVTESCCGGGAPPETDCFAFDQDFPVGQGMESDSYCEGEYILEAESEPVSNTPVHTISSQSNEEERPSAPLTPAQELANFYFTLLGSPAEFKKNDKAWDAIAKQMLSQYSMDDIKGAAEWALKINNYWPEAIYRLDRDPLQFFAHKLSTILPQYLGFKNARNHKRTNTKENNHVTTNKKSKSASIHDHNLAVGEQVKRELRGES
jgi:hypothetical protein